MVMKVILFERRGEFLYAIMDLNTQLLFAWCYVHKGYAEEVAKNLPAPINFADRAHNWKGHFSELRRSDREFCHTTVRCKGVHRWEFHK